MKRRDVIYYTDIAMLAAFAACAVTGFIKWPGLLNPVNFVFYGLTFREITLLHDYSGLLFVIFCLIHLFLHGKRFIVMTKNKLK